jgi:hypothetical protein
MSKRFEGFRNKAASEGKTTFHKKHGAKVITKTPQEAAVIKPVKGKPVLD